MGDERPARRKDDYNGIFPGRVRPTGGLEVLERDGNLLFIKSYADGTSIVKPHERIWQLMTSISNIVDAPGNITVACVWGLKDTRTVYIYDYRGDGPMRVFTKGEWQQWLRDWLEGATR
jgi:hypothetical protein